MTSDHENPNSLIQVPRDLIRRCATVLSKCPSWKRRPCTSLKWLVQGLNGLFASHPLLKYRSGFPRPAQVKRELEGIRGWASKGNTDRLAARLDELAERQSDSVSLLLYQLGSELEPDNTERAASDPKTLKLLRNLAKNDPKHVASLAERAMALMTPLIKRGRGGSKNRGKTVDREIAFELGNIFLQCTGRNPGTTYKFDKRVHTGPFIRFAEIVFKELGYSLNSRQVFERYSSLSIPEWQAGKRRWPASKANTVKSD